MTFVIHRLSRSAPALPKSPRADFDDLEATEPAGDRFEGPKFQSPSEVAKMAEQLSAKHSARRMGSDPKTESNCSIYTFDVIQSVVEKDGGKLDGDFQLRWMNAKTKNVQFDGKDVNGLGPANALRDARLGYAVATLDSENFDLASKKLMKGDFVQLQATDGGHQGVLTGWGRGEDGKPWLEIRGFQRNPETGWIDVNVKKVHLKDPEGHNTGREWDRAIVARYDPNETHRPRREPKAREPAGLLAALEIPPVSTTQILSHLRLR